MDYSQIALFGAIQKAGDNLTLVLRENQHIVAQILKEMDGKVLLSVNGTKILANLSAPEQAEALQQQQIARFIVRNVTPQSVELQLVPFKTTANQTGAPLEATPAAAENLAKALLQTLNLPADKGNIQLTHALLENSLHITPSLVQNLRQMLDSMGKWGASELQTALQLLRSGLPLTPAAIALYQRGQQQELPQIIPQLQQQLGSLLQNSELSNLLTELIRNTISQLEKFFIRLNDNPQQVQQNVQNAVQMLGRSLERDLAELILAGQSRLPEKASETLMLTLSSLRAQINQMLNDNSQNPQLNQLLQNMLQNNSQAAQILQNALKENPQLNQLLQNMLQNNSQAAQILQNALKENPQLNQLLQNNPALSQLLQDNPQNLSSEVLQSIDRLIEQMRATQFQNLPTSTEPAQGQWAIFDLPLRLIIPHTGTQQAEIPLQTARLRVAYQSQGEKRSVDPNYTRLIIEVDVNAQETIEIDLSIASQKIGAEVTASNEALLQAAEEEFPELQSALEKAGYQVLTSKFETGEFPSPTLISSNSIHNPFLFTNNGLNMEA